MGRSGFCGCLSGCLGGCCCCCVICLVRAIANHPSIAPVILSIGPVIMFLMCILPTLPLQWENLDGDFAALTFGVSAIFYMLVDALFLYVPLINEETKCVMLDNRLKIAAIVLRSFGDLRYVVRICRRIKDGRRKSHSLKRIAMSIANDMVCILPVPQVVILIFLPKMRGTRSLKKMKFLNSLILLQYLPRLYPIYKMCKQVNKDTVLDNKLVGQLKIRIPKWFAIAVNIFGYILASHVLGAFWYLFSIQREIDCWGYACRIENGCEFSTSCDKNTIRNITLLNSLCPINPPDATIFDFGIFLHALQSGMQASTNFPEKFLQCFLWGLRNLSSFASNLDTSAYGWENFFVAVIAIFGLVLFMYLLGHTQTFMQAADKSSRILQKMDIINPKITYMASEYDLPIWKIEQDVKQILEDDENFVAQNIFSVLQPWRQEEIKRFLCNKVKLSKPWRQEEIKRFLCNKVKLSKVFINIEITWTSFGTEPPREEAKEIIKKEEEEIIEHLEQVSYTGGSYIIRKGEPLDMIFFIALGNVVTYSTTDDGSSGSSTTIELKKFEWYGEKLLIPWATWSSSNFSNLPISPITVKSHKQVDIFAIKATDLKYLASEYPGMFNTEFHRSTDNTGQAEIAVEIS